MNKKCCASLATLATCMFVGLPWQSSLNGEPKSTDHKIKKYGQRVFTKKNVKQVATHRKKAKLTSQKALKKIEFVSYAQVLEDLILYDVLGDVKNGFYIDVGANHPIHDSVTKFFYENGYRGINIEPLLKEYGELVIDRDRDVNLCVCAGENHGELGLYEKGKLSTLDPNIAKTWKYISSPRKVKIVPLGDICKEYCPRDQEIQFCKIDVEGFEREVLLGFDFQNFRPKIFVIEATEPCTMIPTQQKWEDILLANDYEFAYQYGINRYYVDRNLPELKQKFIGVERLNEKYLVLRHGNMKKRRSLVQRAK
ncbi:MAG: FkbM family methyltransferase [Puniceicoccales bacterium]|jgi:FkbM family methyltransferase|nr:FkbM family methyltransferase [Puniceicoccales bacterium]